MSAATARDHPKRHEEVGGCGRISTARPGERIAGGHAEQERKTNRTRGNEKARGEQASHVEQAKHGPELLERRLEEERRRHREHVPRGFVGRGRQPEERQEKERGHGEDEGALAEPGKPRGAQVPCALLSAWRKRKMQTVAITAMPSRVTLAIADARPMLKNSRPCLTAWSIRLLVASPGPPPVVT